MQILVLIILSVLLNFSLQAMGCDFIIQMIAAALLGLAWGVSAGLEEHNKDLK